MCRHRFGWHERAWHRRRYMDAESFFTVVIAMIREAIAVLAQARRELQELATPFASRPTGHDLKPTVD